VGAAPVDRAATLALARRARRLLIKTGNAVVRIDTALTPFTDADAAHYLVHEDGFLRVPVLVVDDVLVRGYTEDLYQEVLDGPPPAP
jgi:arsenate reductase-like glutaredoxin family protein